MAVDGPGGVGKSTVSRLVAENLGAAHLDTGAFYRAATLVVLEDGADPTDAVAVMRAWGRRDISQRNGSTFVDGRDVSKEIRTEEVTAAVSVVAAHLELRARMVDAQRRWVAEREGPAVVEGRDIGSVVFPDAKVKVYLDAHPKVRARRRSRELGAEAQVVAKALHARDRVDSSRAVSPLVAASDAVLIDTTDLSIDQVVTEVMDLVHARLS
ncbi:(d)CMP kinase [soil metagenome]